MKGKKKYNGKEEKKFTRANLGMLSMLCIVVKGQCQKAYTSVKYQDKRICSNVRSGNPTNNLMRRYIITSFPFISLLKKEAISLN